MTDDRKALIYKPRELSRHLGAALGALPVVVLTGLRQSGKTTFLREDPLFAGWRYITLDDFAVREAALRSPEALLASADRLIIDEAQQAPDLLRVVKQRVDGDRRPGRFVLSGSANFSLLRDVSESLAGRALYLQLQPFSRRERLAVTQKPVLSRLLEEEASSWMGSLPAIDPVEDSEVLDGGFPSVALGEVPQRQLFFLGYEQTYLERDVRSLAQVGDLVGFRQVLHLAALRSGQLLNTSEVARDAKMPSTTVNRYLGLLEASFVVSRLQPFLKSRVTRLVKSPKLYLSDSGLAAYLTGVRDLHPAAAERLRGALWETWVRQQLVAWLGAYEPSAELFFWNVQGRHEIDFIIDTGALKIAIEVKAATRFTDQDLAGLRAFSDSTDGRVLSILAYNGRECVPLGANLYALPIAHLVR